MKVRLGFVTNSSSSSFLVLGICEDDIIEDVIKKNDIEDPVSFHSEHELEFICQDSYPYYLGVYPMCLLEKMTLPEAKEKVREYFRTDLGLDVDISLIDLYFGEVTW